MLKYGRKIRILLGDDNISYTDFAEELDVDRTTVSDSWVKRAIKPRPCNASKIYDYFEGQITFSDMGYTAEELGYHERP
jgi:predicted regulator of amino acid metabolism with ACT domain